MTARELMQRYAMAEHVENGMYLERHYVDEGTERPASGSIYYYVAPGEKTEFHVIDCDEYWCYVEGEPLELWLVDEKGGLERKMLGVEEGCEPFVYVRKGLIFASRHLNPAGDGCFLICLTVPRFRSEGFTLLTEEEITEKCPAVREFFAGK